MSLAGLFAWPAALPALLLVPALFVFLRVRDARRASRQAALAGPRSGRLAGEVGIRRRRLRPWLLSAALACALLAVAQPTFGADEVRVEQRSADVLVCLDVSRSMLARDLPPDRLSRAREEIAALAARARGDRLGLVVFAGEARLAVPLTRDRESFAELARLADPLAVAEGGTDLGAALDTALAALEAQHRGAATADHATVLLITDGEDLEQRGLRAAERLAERGVPVHGVGFGTPLGSKITVVDAAGREVFLRDAAGDEVVTRMDPTSLGAIAETTGGAFVDAARTPRPLVTLYEEQVLPMARRTLQAERRLELGNRYQWPLALAVAFWLLELALGARRRR